MAALSASAAVAVTLTLTHRQLSSHFVSDAPKPTTTSLPPTTTTTLPGFNDGAWLVNKEIKPGRYELNGVVSGPVAGASCYWARLQDASGTDKAKIQDDNAEGHVIVEILPTDGAFQSSNCGRWSIYTAEPNRLTAFGDGTWAVNMDIAPGLYRSSGGEACYWARASSFENDIKGLIATQDVNGRALVQISPSDAAFTTRGCGHWTMIG